MESKRDKRKRPLENYADTESFLSNEINRYVKKYKSLGSDQQKRLCRDLIACCLRRSHQYCIKERFKGKQFNYAKAHYFQDRISGQTECDHLLPVAMLINRLLTGNLGIIDTLNAPIVRLSKENHKRLANCNGDPKYPFKRYRKIKVKIFTCLGAPVDINKWTMDDHNSLVMQLQQLD